MVFGADHIRVDSQDNLVQSASHQRSVDFIAIQEEVLFWSSRGAKLEPREYIQGYDKWQDYPVNPGDVPTLVLGLVAENSKSLHPASRISVDVVLTSETLRCSMMGTGLCANPNCEVDRVAAYIA
ncbi:hypothetical protein SNOG_03109 [Parastagonospora nodorum SN15]|uniref:Uncharacterized protein n=1 Tax=Phaeosphaeria nodorum (strain SN15 / ATCC MYA-4574 / FGSC 10173) TaxID=321614 RepID=Q0UYQ5_PHANO|nr:hypothetical protein SNOG_03109 [Parastagonospora nodorum SN15]EAT89840.1 hypothetical protein SNOG_03109 [Parastagonospora nodorum SN15]